jgi:hypothetical protein
MEAELMDITTDSDGMRALNCLSLLRYRWMSSILVGRLP